MKFGKRASVNFPARVLVLIVAGMVAATLVALGAAASHLELADTNDTRGPLDISSVLTGGGERPRWKVITFASWTKKEIWDSGYITINLDTRGTPRVDYYILVGSTGLELYGELWRDRATRPDFRLSSVKVWREGPRSVTARVPLAQMRIGAQRLTYGWYVQTILTGDGCPRACFDLAPDQAFIEEPLPIVAPSPTISSSPSPTPSPSS